MKILWVNPNFLHPTTKGGQIRTLEMLRRLSSRHEIHYAAIENPAEREGVAHSQEYCYRAWPFHNRITSKRSPAFAVQLARGLFSPVPLAISRFYSPEMAVFLRAALEERKFDCVVCDFLVSAVNFPSLHNAILFQHNVETMLWRRRVEQAANPFRQAYLSLQARRMFAYEGRACRESRHVVSVSENDTRLIREMFGVSHVADIPTGSNVEFFAPPAGSPRVADLVFIGSMDWMPNIDGMLYFTREILPLIRRRKPDCSVVICGRDPAPEIRALAERDPRVSVTGTVADVRPYLWGSLVSIVPLRVGGGTRLKIYEAMAARVPVVSTAVGAEGLAGRDGEHLFLADAPAQFADRCVALMESDTIRRQIAESAWLLVSSSFSWEQVTRCFEQVLESSLASSPKG
jgi:glycosyltransferase involved in cell wall biosynthesis